jgi:cation diffusion facilitator family transporter
MDAVPRMHMQMNEKASVALGSIAASAGMTVAKFAVGLATGSLAVISEAIHNLLDLGATVITYAAVRVSDRPADRNHPYGHGKIESVAALAETALLFLTSAWIVWEAVSRIAGGQGAPEATWWSIAVIAGSIVIDYGRVRALRRVAKKTRSQALEADALHFSSDIASSAVVLVGLGVVALGWRQADAWAAIGVAVFVCLAGWRLGRRTIDALTDAAPAGILERVERIVHGVPGVAQLGRVRARPAGAVLFVDVEVKVNRILSLDEVGAIRDRIIAELVREMPEAEVTVDAQPLMLDNETIYERVLLIAARMRLAVHHVTIQDVAGRLSVSLDLEVEGDWPLGRAHDSATALEAAIRAAFGREIEVETHIEPMRIDGARGTDADGARIAAITARLNQLAAEDGGVANVHDVRVRETPHGVFMTLHCQVAPERTVEEVHDAVDALERRVRREWPEARRVVIHAEPFGA